MCLAGLVTVHAQQPASTSATPNNAPLQRLTLADAQRIAFEKNWDLLAAAAGVDAATAQKIVVHEFPNPTLSLYSSLINVDNHPSSTSEGNGLWDRSYDTIFAINQLFEIGGKRRSRKVSAQAGFEGAKAQLFDARRTLDVAVAKAYVAAAQAEENVRVLLQSAGTLREEARIAEVRLRAGEISSSDKSQIEITAEQFELNAQSAKSAAAQARVALEVLLGVPHPDGGCRPQRPAGDAVRGDHAAQHQFRWHLAGGCRRRRSGPAQNRGRFAPAEGNAGPGPHRPGSIRARAA